VILTALARTMSAMSESFPIAYLHTLGWMSSTNVYGRQRSVSLSLSLSYHIDIYSYVCCVYCAYVYALNCTQYTHTDSSFLLFTFVYAHVWEDSFGVRIPEKTQRVHSWILNYFIYPIYVFTCFAKNLQLVILNDHFRGI
jgi:hypothetical protein